MPSAVATAETWQDFLAQHFPERLTYPLSRRHIRLWEWFARLSPGVDLPVRIEGWPRGGGKSTSVQDGIAWLATKGEIKFVLYVCGTQADAQMHLASIATRLEKLGLKKAEGLYGRSKGYNKSVIRCSNGFSIKAVGLDQAIRGVSWMMIGLSLLSLMTLMGSTTRSTSPSRKKRRSPRASFPAVPRSGVTSFLLRIP